MTKIRVTLTYETNIEPEHYAVATEQQVIERYQEALKDGTLDLIDEICSNTVTVANVKEVP